MAKTSCSPRKKVPGKAILNHHSANAYCTSLAVLKLLECSFLLLTDIMQSLCNCSNEGSSLPTSIFRKHESHITLRCQFLHCFPQDPRKAEREGGEQKILAAAFWAKIFIFTYKQGTITNIFHNIAFFSFSSYSWKIQISVYSQILIFISPLEFCSAWCHTLPVSSEIMKDSCTILPTQKLMHLFLGLAHRILTQLQKLKTPFHLGDLDIAKTLENKY